MARAPSQTFRGLLLATVGLASAPLVAAGPVCAPAGGGVTLPADLDETSGVAVSLRDPEVFWTHNDGGADLYAIDAAGRVRARFTVEARVRDWEDVAVGRCSVGSCLYLADSGDNAERRPGGDVRILRVAEPDPASAEGPLEAEAFPVRLPDGPRDIEALFVLPDERLYLITKGRNHAVAVYRYPAPLSAATVELEEVQTLSDGAVFLLDQVTGADASPDGQTVVVRTYQSLHFYRVEADTLARVGDGPVNLRSLEEPQGEGVGFALGGRVVLTSEGGPFGASASMHVLTCQVPEV